MKSCMWAAVSEVGVHQKHTEQGPESFGQLKALPQKGRAVVRKESAERQDYMSAPPLTSHLEQNVQAEDEKNMEELDEEVDWSSGHWRSCSLLDHRIATQFTSKVYVFSDSVSLRQMSRTS